MNTFLFDQIQLFRRHSSRRSFLAGATAAAGALSFRDALAVQAAELRKEGRALIVLWMQGGPSQLETFDPKPGTDNGGPTEAINTAVSGIQIAQGWEKTAAMMKEIAVIRSMTNKEGQHDRATYQLHTGYIPSGSVKHPSFGANLAHEIAPAEHALPSVVTIGEGRGAGISGTSAGFLGVDYEPFHVSNASNPPENVAPLSGDSKRYQRRLGLLGRLEEEFAARGGAVVVNNHRRIYDKSSKLVLSPEVKAFDLSGESDETKSLYGDSTFSKGCLLARRLVESGVTFVEVRMNGWDTHDNNFERVKTNAAAVDPGMAGLIADLKQRGLLDKTMVVWMGEFGRTPKINPRTGRDHYPRCFNALVAGGGVKGGQIIGSSSKDGTTVADRPVTVPDFLQSVCHSLNVNAAKENMSPLGRPMKIVDGGEVVQELFA
jgi:uncharacterized protein (DUF1501 family)